MFHYFYLLFQMWKLWDSFWSNICKFRHQNVPHSNDISTGVFFCFVVFCVSFYLQLFLLQQKVAWKS